MCTVPAGSAGEVATIWVAVSEVMVAAVVPKVTALAPERLAPVMVTKVPPAVGPLVGLTPLTLGPAGAEAGAMAALMFAVVRPALTFTALAVDCVGWLLYHCVTKAPVGSR